MDSQNFSALSKITSHIAAVTCTLVANFGFLAVAFTVRDKFMLFEFYLSICFIETVMYVICERLIGASLLRSLAKQQGKQLEQITTLLKEQTKLLGEYKQALKLKE